MPVLEGKRGEKSLKNPGQSSQRLKQASDTWQRPPHSLSAPPWPLCGLLMPANEIWQGSCQTVNCPPGTINRFMAL